jgi:uncharacterized protein (TIGR01777 family)
MKVAVTGATGFVGRRLVERLLERGDQVVAFSRDAAKAKQILPGVEAVTYQPTVSGDWQQAVDGCDAVVNLAGEPIGEKRWTPSQKQQILESRQLGTRKIVEAIAQAQQKPQVLVNASAVGYYGTSETARFDETSPAGDDFLAEVCQAWEAEAQAVTATGTRLVILRFGIVLGPGGAIAKMVPIFQLFAGGPIGNGRQWFSWIQREDLVTLLLRTIDQPSLSGTYNATAPNPVRMSELSQILGQVLQRPSWLPVPAFALEALLGEGAQVVLEGQQVLPERLLNERYGFQYPDLKVALQQFLP